MAKGFPTPSGNFTPVSAAEAAEIAKIGKEYQQEMLRIEKQRLDTQAKMVAQDAASDKFHKAAVKYATDTLSVVKDREAATREIAALTDKVLQREKDIEKLLRSKKAGAAADAAAAKAQNKLDQDRMDLLRAEKKIYDSKMEAFKRLQDFQEKQIANHKETVKLLQSALQTVSKIATIGWAGFNIPVLGTQIKGLKSIIEETFTAPSEIFRKYGFVDQYAPGIDSLRGSMAHLNVTSLELNETYAQLGKQLPEFDTLSRTMQDELAKTTLKMTRAGFSTTITTKAIQDFTKSLGQTPAVAAKSVESLGKLAKTLQVGEQAFSDFTALSPKLVGFGNHAYDVFTKTEIAAKKLSISATELFDSMDKYGTFESAANAAGEFNLALGGQYINALDLMQASLEDGPIPTLKLLQDSFHRSGESVDSLTRAQRRYMASSLGLSEDTFTKAFKQRSGGIEKYIKDTEAAAKRSQDIAEKSQHIFEKLQGAFNEVFTKPENVKALQGVVEAIANLATFASKFAWILANPMVIGVGLFIGAATPIATMALSIAANLSIMEATGSVAFTRMAVGAKVAAGAIGGIIGALSLVHALNQANSNDAAESKKGKSAAAWGLGLGALAAGTLLIPFTGGASLAAGMGVMSTVGLIGTAAGAGVMIGEGVGDVSSTGSHLITTPSGRTFKTDPNDTVTAHKAGNNYDDSKMDKLITLLEQFVSTPQPISVQIEGREVVKAIQKTQRYNPFV